MILNVRNIITSLFFVSFAFGQNWEVTLTSDEVLKNISLKELQGNFLLVTNHNSPAQTTTLLPVNEIKEIRHITTRKVNPPIKRRLIGAAVGLVAGYGAGYLFSNATLWWLSNEEASKFSLGLTSSEDLSGGDQLLVKTFTQFSVAIGALHGYNWGVKTVKDTRIYNFSTMSPDEKVNTIRNILHPPSKSIIKKLLYRIKSTTRRLLKSR